MRRSALFTLLGVSFFLYWLLVERGRDDTWSQTEWRTVLPFSAVLLLLALALPRLARLEGASQTVRAGLVASFGAALSSGANIVEDGLGIDSFFFVFVLGTGIMLLGLVGLTIVLLWFGPRGGRRLALVSAGTLAGIVLFVPAGGPILLFSWLTAAVLASKRPGADALSCGDAEADHRRVGPDVRVDGNRSVPRDLEARPAEPCVRVEPPQL